MPQPSTRVHQSRACLALGRRRTPLCRLPTRGCCATTTAACLAGAPWRARTSFNLRQQRRHLQVCEQGCCLSCHRQRWNSDADHGSNAEAALHGNLGPEPALTPQTQDLGQAHTSAPHPAHSQPPAARCTVPSWTACNPASRWIPAAAEAPPPTTPAAPALTSTPASRQLPRTALLGTHPAWEQSGQHQLLEGRGRRARARTAGAALGTQGSLQERRGLRQTPARHRDHHTKGPSTMP